MTERYNPQILRTKTGYLVAAFFHEDTSTWSYCVSKRNANGILEGALIDTVADYAANSGELGFQSAQRILSYIAENNISIRYILETHIHADHLSAGAFLSSKIKAPLIIGHSLEGVLLHWIDKLGLPKDLSTQETFDMVWDPEINYGFADGWVRVIHTPGHTPADSSFLFSGELLFVGDTLFMPDVGSGRCDFPGGSANASAKSIMSLYSLSEDTKIFVGHDYSPSTRAVKFFTTVAEQKQHNIGLSNSISVDEFIKTRSHKDQGKAPPRLLYPSLAYNLRGKRVLTDFIDSLPMKLVVK